ncbi:MAG TPA: MBL fold metallo-hydrolase, partial [Chloroflexia bacterium]|nr:MBL fold metallo-hydrolase [Chloroflexia bacterium]
MQIRLLGVHQGESKTTKFISILVDEVLAIDAGSLASGLTFDEQKKLSTILVTHCHYDHIKDIPMVAFNTMHNGQIMIYCQPDTREALELHIMNQSIWPKMYDIPRPEAPSIRFCNVEAQHAFRVGSYTVLPVSMKHAVPTVGSSVAQNGKSFFFTSDTGGDCHDAWLQMKPDLIICEATLPDRLVDDADAYGHLTPSKIEHELR